MRTAALVVSLAVVGAVTSGCAHVELVAFDNAAKTFTLCGNKWAQETDLRESADRCRKGAAVQLRCGAWGQVAGAAIVCSTAYANYSEGWCCTYQCRD